MEQTNDTTVSTPVSENTPTITVTIPDQETTTEVTPIQEGQIVITQSDNIQNPETIPQEPAQTTSENVDNMAKNEELSTMPEEKEEESGQNTEASKESTTETLQGEIVEEKNTISICSTAGRPCGYCSRRKEIDTVSNDYLERARIARKQGKPFIPYLQFLADDLDTTGDQLTEWAEKLVNDEIAHPHFNRTLKKINNIKEGLLLIRTMSKNPTGAIFQLKTNYGYIEAEKRILTGERQADPIQLNTVNYKDSTKQLPPIQQAVIEEGSE